MPHAATSWIVSLRQNPPTRTLRLVPRWPQRHLCLALSLPTARCKHSSKLWTSHMRTSRVYHHIPTRLQSTLKFWPIKGTSLLKLGSLAHTVGCNLQHPMASQTLDQEEAHAEEVRARRHRRCARSHKITIILPECFQQHGTASILVSSVKFASPKALRRCHVLPSRKGACHRFTTLGHNNNLLTHMRRRLPWVVQLVVPNPRCKHSTAKQQVIQCSRYRTLTRPTALLRPLLLQLPRRLSSHRVHKPARTIQPHVCLPICRIHSSTDQMVARCNLFIIKVVLLTFPRNPCREATSRCSYTVPFHQLWVELETHEPAMASTFTASRRYTYATATSVPPAASSPRGAEAQMAHGRTSNTTRVPNPAHLCSEHCFT